MPGVVRKKFEVGKKVVQSPVDPKVEFTIRKLGNRAIIARRDLNSTVRYIDRADGRVVEQDVPVGEIQMADVLMLLEDWNLTDDKGVKIPVNEDTVQDYLDPDGVEFRFILTEGVRLNPVVFGGAPERKDDEEKGGDPEGNPPAA